MGLYEDEDDVVAGGQQNGTMVLHSSFGVSTQPVGDDSQRQRLPTIQSGQSFHSRVPTPKCRQGSPSSLIQGVGRMDINVHFYEEGDNDGNQAVSNKENCDPTCPPQSDGLAKHSAVRHLWKTEASAKSALQKKSGVLPPQTPTCTAQKVYDAFARMDRLMTHMETPRTLGMSPSPSKCRQPFLTRDSNTRGFTAWDVNETLYDFKSQFKAIQETVNESLNERKALVQVVDFAKTRGTLPWCLGCRPTVQEADTKQRTTFSASGISSTRRTHCSRPS